MELSSYPTVCSPSSCYGDSPCVVSKCYNLCKFQLYLIRYNKPMEDGHPEFTKNSTTAVHNHIIPTHESESSVVRAYLQSKPKQCMYRSRTGG
uniref:Uncharacterized protein n=1 Tax=Arundo donax TaxID=35708 RepID=A0A0A9BRR6_ARUDO